MKYSKKYDFHFTDREDYKLKYYQAIKERKIKQSKEWRKNNPEKRKGSEERYRGKNKEKIKKRKVEWQKVNKDKSYGYCLKNKYGITLEDLKEMIVEQDNKCLRCGKPFEGVGYEQNAPVVDHDHSYPKGDPDSIRGIIHGRCNFMIGQHKDSIEELELSVDYLKKYSKVV